MWVRCATVFSRTVRFRTCKPIGAFFFTAAIGGDMAPPTALGMGFALRAGAPELIRYANVLLATALGTRTAPHGYCAEENRQATASGVPK